MIKEKVSAAMLSALITIVAATSSVSASEVNSHAGVEFTVQLIVGNKPMTAYNLHTIEGVAARVNVGSSVPYVASSTVAEGKTIIKQETVQSGLSLSLTPSIKKSGKIDIAYDIEMADLPTFEKKEINGVAIQIPHTDKAKTNGSIEVNDGNEALIPLNLSKDEAAFGSRYKLRVVAKKE